MSLISRFYSLLRFSRDLNAISRGPKAIVKREMRKALYKKASKIITKIVPNK